MNISELKKILLRLQCILLLLTATTHLNAMNITTDSAAGASDYQVITQLYGYVGDTALGIGWNLPHQQKLYFMLGRAYISYLNEYIHQYAIKYEWSPFKPIVFSPNPKNNITWNIFHIGSTIIYTDHKEVFTVLPDHYPKGYYHTTAFHYTFNIGTYFKIEQLEFFIEYSFLDSAMVMLAESEENRKFVQENCDYEGLECIGSLGFGVRHDF